MKFIKVMAMMKDSGCKSFEISRYMLADLAVSIAKDGSETIHTASGSYVIVGLMITGNQTGERVIILGSKDNANEQ